MGSLIVSNGNMGETGCRVYENYGLLSQFFSKSKTVLKNKVYF